MVAGLAGTVAAALLAGTVISTYFAVQSDRRAAEAQAAEDNLEREVALGVLWPLDPTEYGKLSQPEVEALWRLASTTSERLRLRFSTKRCVRKPQQSSCETGRFGLFMVPLDWIHSGGHRRKNCSRRA